MLKSANAQGEQSAVVIIKKYANRRLYNTETSTYVTLEDLAQMVRDNRDFLVRDAKSSDDLTHAVLTQIIVEQESRAGGPTLLPIPFLRQLIRYYDDSISKVVPSYLQFSLETLAQDQDRFRTKFSANPWGGNAFEAYQDHARRNLAIFEKAMTMWAPAGTVAPKAAGTEAGATDETAKEAEAGAGAKTGLETGSDAAPSKATDKKAAKSKPAKEANTAGTEIDQLKDELAAMQRRIENLSGSSGS